MTGHKCKPTHKVVIFAACFIALTSASFSHDGIEKPEWAVAFADRIFAAWRDAAPMPQISASHPKATLEEAYHVQQLFVERIMASDSVGGFKAAGVANPAPDYPLTAVMPASGVLNAADDIVIDLAKDPSRHVENEIGYIFDKAITAPVADVETLKKHVRAIVAIVEVPGNPVEKTQPGTANDIVAWNINAKEMILGSPKEPTGIDPDAIAITSTRDGEIINEARGDMAAGGQWHTLLKTVGHVLAQGYEIQAGHIITNGALGKILKAKPGHYRADYGALGVIEFEMR